jgi:hypothetical protein
MGPWRLGEALGAGAMLGELRFGTVTAKGGG